MTDPVDRQAILEYLKPFYMTGEDVDLDELLHFLRDLPSSEAQPDTHAHWFEVGSLSCRCSACGCKNDRETAYCPHCGSKMVAKNL